MPRVVVCGTRRSAYDDFAEASKNASPDELIILLVDSEDAVPQSRGSWEYLKGRDEDGWAKPVGAGDRNAQLMVQCMEAWFMADKDAVAGYFGQGFIEGRMPPNPNVEEIPKRDVLNGLKEAARHTQKGKYEKGEHSFGILERLDPEKVVLKAPHAKALVDLLRS